MGAVVSTIASETNKAEVRDGAEIWSKRTPGTGFD